MVNRLLIGLCYVMAAFSLSLIAFGAHWPTMIFLAACFVFLGFTWPKIVGFDRRLVEVAERLTEVEEQVEPIEENEDSFTLTLTNAARTHSTDYLIATHRRGVALGSPWPQLLTAIELVLDEREVPLGILAAPCEDC